MKKLADISKNSSIAFTYIDARTPSPEYAPIVEAVLDAASNLNIPSKIFVRSQNSHNSAFWFGKIFEGISFEETEFDNPIDLAEEQKRLFRSVYYVGDLPQNLVEGITVLPSPRILSTEADIYSQKKNYIAFSNIFEDSGLSESNVRKLYTQINPPQKFSSLIENISETRQKFYLGETLAIGDIVEDDSQLYEIVDRGSNYVVVVDQHGNTSRKFPQDLSESNHSIDYSGSYFKGVIVSEEFKNNRPIKDGFDQTIRDYENGIVEDAFAIIKSIKLVDKMILGESIDIEQVKSSISRINQSHNHGYLEEMSNSNQLQAAKIIADAVGCNSSGNNATEIVNNAIKAALKKSNQRQLEILKAMLTTASKIGLKYDNTLLESMDDQMMRLHKDFKMLKEKPTKDVLATHKEFRKIGVDYDARDVGGKRAMIADIISHNHGPNSLKSYKNLSSSIRKSMNEEQIDEISVDTMKSYISKAGAPVSHKKDPLAAAVKRFKGMDRATSKIHTKELKAMQDRLSKPYVKEATAYGQERAGEHEFAQHGSNKTPKARYKLTDKKTGKVVSYHNNASDAVSARTKLKGSHSTHSIDLTEVHNDPDYATERSAMGYNDLKKNLAKMTGIQNYGEQEPNKPIDLVDKNGVVVSDKHTKPGFSLSNTDTVRKMKVQKLRDN